VPAIAGRESALTIDEVMLGAAVGERVLIVAEEPGYSMLGLATRFADAGHAVTVATSAASAGDEITLATGDFAILYPRLVAAGVEFRTAVLVSDVTGGTVSGLDAMTSAPVALGSFDSVVLLVGREPEADLFEVLRDRLDEVHCIGDALAPRRLDAAVLEGDRLGRAL
jgi:hypothetical protein